MGSNHITANVGDAYRKTADFRRKEKEIGQEIDLKYESMLTSEKTYSNVQDSISKRKRASQGYGHIIF